MASNAVLNRKGRGHAGCPLLAGLTDQTEHVYGEAAMRRAPGSKSAVLIKAEVVRAEDKARRIPAFRDHEYEADSAMALRGSLLQRGEIENRIKELHALEIDRTSCSRFWANQFRVLLTAAAYVLMQNCA